MKEHGLFARNENSDITLNFVASLLIECGFLVTRSVLTDALGIPLHASDVAYIKKYLNGPRSLAIIYRDVLRRYFKGRDIFRFVEIAQCPNRIKEIVLMTKLVRSIDDRE